VAAEHTTAIFAAQLILLLFFGRMLGEIMSRLGQPAIFGQLLAGVVLGPSIFGALLPEVRDVVFPGTPVLKSMVDAISQIGILLLLLLTGMETNLSLINRRRGAVISTSLFGIAVPFACGVLLAYALPQDLIPSPAARLVTALFLGTALSISSVKIVAMVLMEVGAIRRDLGQLILATAILDDTIAWVMIAVIAAIAAHGTVSLANVGASVAGTAVFLALSLTVGRGLVARIIRWSNDNMTIEVPVITVIVLVMLVMALSTELIGVHTALGAFVAGMLVGQSPILTEHIEGHLRGFIIAFFSPVFFAVAGLNMDLSTLLNPTLLLFTLAVIAVASIGKFLGALAGGWLGGLTRAESLGLATALNARGSTEVIIASIGLSMGILSNQLFTMIIAMALVTTMVMPPTLRWVLARIPLREEEAGRLEKEEAEERETVPNMERALAYLDRSPNGMLGASLAGIFAARQQVLITVMTANAGSSRDGAIDAGQRLAEAAAVALKKIPPGARGEAASTPRMSLEQLVHTKADDNDDALEKESSKGYDIVFVGIEHPISVTANQFEDRLQRLVETFEGPLGIVLNGTGSAAKPGVPLNILVPTGGTPGAGLAIEIALALVKASSGALTVLHVFDPQDDTALLRGHARRQGLSLLVEARRLGKRSDVPVKGISVTHARPEAAIQRAARAGQYDLVVVGTSLRQGESKFLGPRSTALLSALRSQVLLLVAQ
jgi:Kef-type K+ transport system membrane component KefB/nucleotide-binding universal stress UspA family protein